MKSIVKKDKMFLIDELIELRKLDDKLVILKIFLFFGVLLIKVSI